MKNGDWKKFVEGVGRIGVGGGERGGERERQRQADRQGERELWLPTGSPSV